MTSRTIKTLKDMSFRSIVLNFEKLFSAYTSRVLPEEYFEFLQLIFSKELFHALLCKKRELKDKYINFLINPHLKELELHYCKITNWQSVTDRLQHVGWSVTTLNLYCVLLDENTFMALTTYLPNVKVLDLCQTGCTDKVLKNIVKFCPLVTVLNISFCTDISDEGLINFCIKDEDGKIVNNNTLTYFDIQFTEVTMLGIQCILKNFHALRTLKHEFLSDMIYEIHKADYVNNSLDTISKYGLVSMMFVDCYQYSLADSIKLCTIMCPYMTTITIMVNEITEIDVQILCECSHLTDLMLFCKSNTLPHNFIEFLKLKGNDLQKLKLTKGMICVKSLSEHCSRLQSLCLRETEFIYLDRSIIVSSKCFFPELTTLTLQVSFGLESVVKSAKFIISSSPKLEKLSLRRSILITESVLSYILDDKSVANLIELDLSYTDVVFESVQKLIESAINLKKLLFIGCISFDFESLQQLINSLKRSIEVVHN